jgi:hypothetical protein
VTPDKAMMADLRDQHAAAPDLAAENRRLRAELADATALAAYLIVHLHRGAVILTRSTLESIDPGTAQLEWSRGASTVLVQASLAMVPVGQPPLEGL